MLIGGPGGRDDSLFLRQLSINIYHGARPTGREGERGTRPNSRIVKGTPVYAAVDADGSRDSILGLHRKTRRTRISGGYFLGNTGSLLPPPGNYHSAVKRCSTHEAVSWERTVGDMSARPPVYVRQAFTINEYGIFRFLLSARLLIAKLLRVTYVGTTFTRTKYP